MQDIMVSERYVDLAVNQLDEVHGGMGNRGLVLGRAVSQFAHGFCDGLLGK